MKKSAIFISIASGLLLGGWLGFFREPSSGLVHAQYQSPSQTSNSPNGNQQMSAGSQDGVVLMAASNSQLGTILVGPNGMTLYTFLNDINGMSTCTGQCASLWPPYIVNQGNPSNIDSSITGEVATVARPDGSLQVTYNGMPLYYYSKDVKSGDTNGQGIAGLWFVAKP